MKNFVLKNLLYAFSALPAKVLYSISDVIFLFHSHVKGYRKDVVKHNLENAFPNKSSEEIKQITKQFFRNFYDFPIESIKGINITQEQLDKRISLENIEIVQKYYDEGKNMMVLCGHLFNWEWLKGLGAHVPQDDIYAVFSIPKSALTNEIIKKSREKFGGETIPMRDAKELIFNIPNDGNSLFLMVADQSPYKKAIRYDLQFLNQTTPVFQGFDKIVRRRNMGVIYLDIQRLARGKYHYKVVDILPDGKEFEENEIVHKFFDLLEKNILKNPSNYMWTHKRWKYKKGIDY